MIANLLEVCECVGKTYRNQNMRWGTVEERLLLFFVYIIYDRIKKIV